MPPHDLYFSQPLKTAARNARFFCGSPNLDDIPHILLYYEKKKLRKKTHLKKKRKRDFLAVLTLLIHRECGFDPWLPELDSTYLFNQKPKHRTETCDAGYVETVKTVHIENLQKQIKNGGEKRETL